MKLSKVAIFTVLSGAMFFATVGSALAEDEQPVPTLYSSVVCADGSDAVVDDNGDSTCPNDVAITATSDVVCDETNAPDACPADGVGTINSVGGGCAVAPEGDNATSGPACYERTLAGSNCETDGTVDSTNGIDVQTPCAVMYDSVPTDSTATDSTSTDPELVSLQMKSGVLTKEDSNIYLPLAGIAFVLALTFGTRKLSK